MTNKLVGRKRECQEIKRVMESDRSEFVIVYGRRRVGKTFLVDQYFQSHYDFTFVGGHNLSRQRQLASFARALKKHTGVKTDKFADWFDAFDALEEYLESLDANRKKVVFIDEMPWIDTRSLTLWLHWRTSGTVGQRGAATSCSSPAVLLPRGWWTT